MGSNESYWGSLSMLDYRCIFTIAVTMMALLSYNVNNLT